MNDNRYCPCCGRHCSLDEPHCHRGEEYRRTGEIPETEGGYGENCHREDYRRENCHGRNPHGENHHGGNPHGKHHHEGFCQERAKSIHSIANYAALDTNNKLIMNLRSLGHMIRFLYEGRESQKRILIILRESQGMTQRELTERIGVQPGSASEVIGKLETAGLIMRTPSATDRRTTDIRLTQAGQMQAEEAAEQRRLRHQEMFSCLSEEEKETLLALAEKLNEDWDARYRGKREPGRKG